jgi:hypothetical protein
MHAPHTPCLAHARSIEHTRRAKTAGVHPRWCVRRQGADEPAQRGGPVKQAAAGRSATQTFYRVSVPQSCCGTSAAAHKRHGAAQTAWLRKRRAMMAPRKRYSVHVVHVRARARARWLHACARARVRAAVGARRHLGE